MCSVTLYFKHKHVYVAHAMINMKTHLSYCTVNNIHIYHIYIAYTTNNMWQIIVSPRRCRHTSWDELLRNCEHIRTYTEYVRQYNTYSRMWHRQLVFSVNSRNVSYIHIYMTHPTRYTASCMWPRMWHILRDTQLAVCDTLADIGWHVLDIL